MFLQLFNLHLCWQASTIKCKIWLLALGRVCVCGTISLQETNWSLSRCRSVQTNQWQLDDEWKTLRSIRKVYLSNTGEKCKNMKGAREGGEVFRDKTDWHGFTFTYMCRLSSWFMEKHYGFTREDTHILARECMFIYSDKRRLSPDPPQGCPMQWCADGCSQMSID